MKISSKPLSSPGRTEKYPPPFMLLMRSNVGSRSWGRSRSSPMFIRKKNSSIESQEPSSPTVTCMGQVRVKRSTQTGSKSGGPGAPTARGHTRCKWIRNLLFFHYLPGKVKAKPLFRPSLKKWGPFFHVGSRTKTKTGEDSSKYGNTMEDSVEESEEDESEARFFVSSCSSPPKNAFILTRCQSAPYRASHLAYRFWGSPLANQDTTEEEKEETELKNRGFKEVEEEDVNPTSGKESICRNPNLGSQMDSGTGKKQVFCNEKNIEKCENNEELKTEQFRNIQPLILTRCKSEPERTAGRLDPDMSFWKRIRLEFI